MEINEENNLKHNEKWWKTQYQAVGRDWQALLWGIFNLKLRKLYITSLKVALIYSEMMMSSKLVVLERDHYFGILQVTLRNPKVFGLDIAWEDTKLYYTAAQWKSLDFHYFWLIFGNWQHSWKYLLCFVTIWKPKL